MSRQSTFLGWIALTLSAFGFFQGCGTSAASFCSDACDKQEECGDVDSVKAEQCRKKCDANADIADSVLDACANKSDIVAATEQCMGQSCLSYVGCMTKVPRCASSTSSVGATAPNNGFCHVAASSDGGEGCFSIDAPTDGCKIGQVVASCPTDGLLGTCTTPRGHVNYYYLGGAVVDATGYQHDCMAVGWSWQSL